MFHCVVSTLSTVFLFRSIFILDSEKSHTVQGWENMEVAACVRFHVWLRNVAQVGLRALVRCHGQFANPLTTTFLVTCGVLH
jgi:hypothetical protein